RPLERVLVQELRVVAEAVPFSQARARRRVVFVESSKHAKQPGRIGDGARNGAGGVLVRSDRHDPATADEPKRWFDANIHVLARRPKERPGRLRPPTPGG